MDFVGATVAGMAPMSTRIHRMVLDVPELDRLRLPRHGDTALGIYLGPTGDRLPPPSGRTYTVRACDPIARRVTVDVVLHGRGVGTDWVLAAKPGDEVALAHPRGWYRPGGADWQLLAADLSGLPALARIVAELPPDTRAIVVVEVIDESDLAYLPGLPERQLIWSTATGNGIADSKLAARVTQQHLPSGRGYCWFAGEAGEARTVRKFFRGELGWQTSQLDVMGYWRRDSESWDRRYADVAAELFGVYQRALAAGKSEKIAAEEFDAALEQAGL